MPGVSRAQNLPKGFDKRNYHFTRGFPVKENCDLDNPREKFLWMMVALPGQRGAQLVMPISYLMMVSEHMDACGAMLACPQCGYSKDSEKVYVPPSANDAHWLTSPGTWMSPDQAPEPAETDPLDDALARLTNAQKAALFDRLKKQMGGEP